MTTPEHTLSSLCQRSHEISKEKGWLENPRPFSAISSLIHSEISEALEDYRANRGLGEMYYEVTSHGSDGISSAKAEYSLQGLLELRVRDGKAEAKPCGIPIELADVIIRVCQWIGTNAYTQLFTTRLDYLERETKWFERHLEDFESFSAMAHSRTSKAYQLWDTDAPEPVHSDLAAVEPLADLTHLVFSFCYVHKIDLWAAIDEKEAFNRTRPIRHGNKRI